MHRHTMLLIQLPMSSATSADDESVRFRSCTRRLHIRHTASVRFSRYNYKAPSVNYIAFSHCYPIPCLLYCFLFTISITTITNIRTVAMTVRSHLDAPEPFPHHPGCGRTPNEHMLAPQA